MAKVVKFTFDTDFDAPPAPPPVPEEEIPPPPVFQLEEFEAARASSFADGHAQGHAAGRAEAEAGIAAATARALDVLAERMLGILDRHDAVVADVRTGGAALAAAVGRKLAATLMAQAPQAEVEALVGACLDAAGGTPRLVVRVAPALAPGLETRLGEMALAAGHQGRIVVAADAAIPAGDATVEWDDGGAARSEAAVMADIETALARFAASMGTI